MPSTMVHILTAYKIKPDSLALFWIGNLAPDCISDRNIKDIFDLRKAADRESALKNFAETIDIIPY